HRRTGRTRRPAVPTSSPESMTSGLAAASEQRAPATRLPRCPPHNLAKRGDRGLGLGDQDVGAVRELIAVLDQLQGSLPRRPRRESLGVREHRTRMGVLAQALGQAPPALWTEMRAFSDEVRAQLLLPIRAAAGGALGHRVIEAELEEKRPLLDAQIPGPLAIGVDDPVAIECDGVSHGEQLQASWTLRIRHNAAPAGARPIARCHEALTPNGVKPESPMEPALSLRLFRAQR